MSIKHLISGIKRSKREKKFNEQLSDGVSLIAGALKAGLSIHQAFEMAASETFPPFCEEMESLVAELCVGFSLEDALKNLSKRMKGKDLQLIIETVLILNDTGGNVVEAFQNISETIKEREKVSRKIRILTAQGTIEAIIIFLMPFVITVSLIFISPDYIRPLFKDPFGILLFSAAIFLQLLGGFLVKKIIMIRV